MHYLIMTHICYKVQCPTLLGNHKATRSFLRWDLKDLHGVITGLWAESHRKGREVRKYSVIHWLVIGFGLFVRFVDIKNNFETT